MPSIEQTVGKLEGTTAGLVQSTTDIKEDLRSLDKKIWGFVLASLFSLLSAATALIVALMKSGAASGHSGTGG